MGLFDFLKKKDKRHNYEYDDNDRELSAAVRRSNAEIKAMQQKIRLMEEEMRLKKVQFEYKEMLEQMRGYEEEGEEEATTGVNAEAMLLNLLMSAKQSNQPQQASVQQTTQITMSDEQIKGYIESIPKAYRRIGRNMTDEQLITFIDSNMPNLTLDTKQRAINILRNTT